MRTMTLKETKHRIFTLVKQHDLAKHESYKAEDTAHDFLGIFDLDGGFTFDKYMKQAQRWLNIAKWVQRTNRIYLDHFEDLTKNKPVKVSFT